MLRQHGELVEATWEQAMEAIVSLLPDYKGDAFSLLLTPRATNQQAYLAGRFAREVMGSNNIDLSVDHRPELVEPLGRRLGAMAATGTLADLENAGCVLVVNSNTTEEHNIAAIPIKKAHKAGGKLIVVDTREVELSRYADLWLRPYPGTELALVGGMLRAILDEGLQDDAFIAEHSGGLDALRESLAGYTLDAVADATGVPADKIAAAARAFAQAGSAAIVYALDNVAQAERAPVTDALLNLALATGNLGKPASGLFPLRPGAASQGALDMGCSPGDAGLSAAQSLEAIGQGSVKAAMVLGDSALFTPEAVHTLTHTDFLVVQSMFMSELAEAADVLLPMTSFAEENGVVTSLDRWALRRRAAIDPPGEARPADFTLTELGHRMGAQDFGGHPAPVLQEIREAVPAYADATDDALDAGGVQLPWSMPERADLTPLRRCSRALPTPRRSSSRRAACSRCRRARSRWCAATARTPSAARTRWNSTRTTLPRWAWPRRRDRRRGQRPSHPGPRPHDGPAARRRLRHGPLRRACHRPRPKRGRRPDAPRAGSPHHARAGGKGLA